MCRHKCTSLKHKLASLKPQPLQDCQRTMLWDCSKRLQTKAIRNRGDSLVCTCRSSVVRRLFWASASEWSVTVFCSGQSPTRVGEFGALLAIPGAPFMMSPTGGLLQHSDEARVRSACAQLQWQMSQRGYCHSPDLIRL